MREPFEESMRAHLRPAVFSAAVGPDDLAEEFYPFLSAPERRRADRFHFRVDRSAYCIAHYLLKACLNLIVGPADWRFERADDGKPHLHPECARQGLQFNLTHSRTKVACAFSFDGPIGVDTEDDYTAPDLLDLAARICSEGECHALSRLEGHSRQSGFARLWTAKEALAKASGKGLSLDLRQFPIDWKRRTFAGAGGDLGDPLHWKIEHCMFGESHMAAAIHSQSRVADAISFDWYRVRLSDLAASSNGVSWDIAAVVDADDRCRNAGIEQPMAFSGEWSRL